MLRDLLYALRTFRQSPGFTAVVVVSIALAIAANATVFSIMNGLLLGSLPVAEPDRLLSFNGGRSMSRPDYLDYRDQTKDIFSGISAHFPLVPASIGGQGEPERVWGQLVSGNYFSVTGVRPSLGRGIAPQEAEVEGRDPVVVLSHGLWQRRFGADPGIIGRTVLLNGAKYTVVGVAPKGFHGTERGIIAEFWAPLTMVGQLMPDIANEGIMDSRGSNWLMLLGRLKPGVNRETALAAVNVVKRRIDDTHFKNDQRRRQRPMTLEKAGGLIDGMSKQVVGLMAVLMVVVGLVLLIACANVANLLLARAAARQKEIAVRLSIGAGRLRLIRQLLTESVVLAAFGAVGGFALAWMAARAISQLRLPLPLPIVFDFTPDLRVLAFTAALTVLTGVLFGLAPALRATRTDLMAALKDQVSGFGRSRRFGMRNTLVVVQVALSLVLLTGAGLFLRSLQNASSIDIGMRPENVLLMAVDPKTHNYSPEKTRQFLAALRERVSALPGVQSVTFLDSIPLSIGGTSFDLKVEGAREEKSVNADIYNVGANFFETMGLPLLRGRDFNLRTDPDGVVINEKLARELFGTADPIGRRLSGHSGSYTVVGIARNAKSRTLGEEPANCAYVFLEPKPENAMSLYGISIAVKTARNPYMLMQAVRREIGALDPSMAVFNTETMSEHVDKAMLVPRLCATLLGVFGATGLTLAAIGLYGVMSYSVRRRTREFGIRIALGAHAGGVLKMVLRQGLYVAGTGLAIGLAIALALGRLTASLLYGVSGTDAVTFVAVPAILLAIALVAIAVPARRAARIEPVRALRYE
ncbi:MAG: ABC transporter permease [bacterium]